MNNVVLTAKEFLKMPNPTRLFLHLKNNKYLMNFVKNQTQDEIVTGIFLRTKLSAHNITNSHVSIF